MTTPSTPLDVMKRMGELSRELDVTVKQMEQAENDAIDKRHAADLAEAKAYLSAEGAVEQRKKAAFVACERLLYEAEMAEAVVRHLRRRISAVGVSIDVGRSYNSALKAEMALGGVS